MGVQEVAISKYLVHVYCIICWRFSHNWFSKNGQKTLINFIYAAKRRNGSEETPYLFFVFRWDNFVFEKQSLLSVTYLIKQEQTAH